MNLCGLRWLMGVFFQTIIFFFLLCKTVQAGGFFASSYNVLVDGIPYGVSTSVIFFQTERYVIHTKIKLDKEIEGFPREQVYISEGIIEDEKLRPMIFMTGERLEGPYVRFDWENHNATVSNAPERVWTIDDTTIDIWSFPFQYYAAQTSPLTHRFKQIIGGLEGLSKELFVVTFDETISNDDWELDTIEVRQLTGSRKMTVWLYPEQDYFPVRIRVKEKNKPAFDFWLVEVITGYAS